MKLSLEFALDIIAYSEILEEHKKFVIARQILKSGTSIGANIREAQNAESKVDFIHKMKIAAKEADETEYWLTLCEMSKNYPFNKNIKEKLQAIIKVIAKIIVTSKSK
ncbi:MAG: four helix bundle protein [Bacteroidales bacterium]|nr:four helix bundle protein [Bacteroidales bacterium]